MEASDFRIETLCIDLNIKMERKIQDVGSVGSVGGQQEGDNITMTEIDN